MAVFAIGVIVAITPRLLGPAQQGNRRGAFRRRPVQLRCPSCQQAFTAQPDDFHTITGTEQALIVREFPQTHERSLSHIRCAHCRAYLVYATDVHPPEYLMSDPILSADADQRCCQCRRPLLPPSWPEGPLDHPVLETPGLKPRHGLVCNRCNSLFCVQCALGASKAKTLDGSLLCPRCFRGPVDQFHHFSIAPEPRR